MRYAPIPFVSLILAGCSKSPSPRPAAHPVSAEVADYLLTSAATDFHTHRPPNPNGFRAVRIGYVTSASGTEQYRLCGEFLPAPSADSASWTPFATLKTSKYEQYLGRTVYCEDEAMAWDQRKDLSAVLQRKLDSVAREPMPQP